MRAVFVRRQLLVRHIGEHAADPALADRASRPRLTRLKIGDLALQLLNLFLRIRLPLRPFGVNLPCLWPTFQALWSIFSALTTNISARLCPD